MAGRVLELLPRTEFDFGYLSTGQQEARALVGKIPTEQWGFGTLMVRVHNASIANSSTIDVQLSLDASTGSDPAHTFTEQTAITNGKVTLSSSSAAGDLDPSSRITAGMGYMLALSVIGSMDEGTQGALQAEISVVLVMKDN